MDQYQVEAIIGKRYVDESRKKPQYLIKWKNYPVQQSSWQPKEHLTNVIDLINSYERYHPEKNLISIVNPGEKTKNIYVDKINSPQQQFKRQQRNKKRRERQKIKKQAKKLQQGLQKKEEKQQPVQNKIFILKHATKNEKTYFKVLQGEKTIWRNRNYMLQFYPKELCNFYEMLILKKQA